MIREQRPYDYPEYNEMQGTMRSMRFGDDDLANRGSGSTVCFREPPFDAQTSY